MSRRWSEDELIIAFVLYCQTTFGKIHSRNPKIIEVSNVIDRTPSALAMKMLNFASLDPEIQKSGRSGLGNASQKDEAIWKTFHDDWGNAFEKADNLLKDEFDTDQQEDYSSEDKKSEVKVRRKQNFFRNTVISSYKGTCCISGLNFPKFLIASHIKPWSVDRQNRLNPRNGICLSVLYDKAFDLGFITITPNYEVNVSDTLIEEATDKFSKKNLHAIEGKRIDLPEKFLPSKSFLEYHNEIIFK